MTTRVLGLGMLLKCVVVDVVVDLRVAIEVAEVTVVSKYEEQSSSVFRVGDFNTVTTEDS